MNTPREAPGKLFRHEYRVIDLPKLPHEEAAMRKLEIGASASVITNKNNGEYIILTKEEAIEAAKQILFAYNVPFCNRVRGAGLKED